MGTEPATVNQVTDETILFTFYPSCLYGPGPLTVTVGDVSHAKQVTPTPMLSDLMGDAGVPGQTVTLGGEGFASHSKVSLSGTVITPVSVANSAITFQIPSGATSGPIKVVIPAAGDQTAVESNAFHFTVGPKPSAISKDYGMPGEFITLTGNFGNTNSTRSVKIGRIACPIPFSSSSTIQFSVPVLGNSPSGLIAITVDGISTIFCPFTILPLIMSIPPKYAAPGEEMRIKGWFHGPEVTLKSAGTSLTMLGKGVEADKDYLAFAIGNDFSATSINMEVKKYQGTGAIPMGSMAIYQRPVLERLEPAFGLAGDNIVLSGRHFADDGATPQVFFGSTQAAVGQSSDTRITVTVPAGSAQQQVTVRRPFPDGSANSFGKVFTYKPILFAFKPSNAVLGGMLEITGLNFSAEGDNQVYVGGVLAKLVSSTATKVVVKVDPKSGSSGIQVFSNRAPSEVMPLKVVSSLSFLSLLLD